MGTWLVAKLSLDTAPSRCALWMVAMQPVQQRLFGAGRPCRIPEGAVGSSRGSETQAGHLGPETQFGEPPS